MTGRKKEFGGARSHDFPDLEDAWENAMDHGAHPAAEMTVGLVLGTLVGTQGGWRPVETLREGDKVMTFDSGLQAICETKHGLLCSPPMACPEPLWPLSVPRGVLGNDHAMTLLPEQPMLLESDAAEDIYGDPFILVPGAALEGWLGIQRVLPADPVEVVALGFEKDQIIYVNGSALAFCPSHVPGTVLTLDALTGESDARSDYTVLSPFEARAVLGDPGSGAPEDVPDPPDHAA